MAIVQNPLIGRTKQKYGNSIFSKWKEHNVIRTKPLQVANPNSIPQRIQRERFKIAIELYRKFKNIVDNGFKDVATNMTQGNLFTSHILNFSLYTNLQGEHQYVPSEIVFQKGNRTGTIENATAHDIMGTKFTFPRKDIENVIGREITHLDNIRLTVIEFSSDKKQILRYKENNTFSLTPSEVEIDPYKPEGLSNFDNAGFYIDFTSSDQKIRIDTIYPENVMVLM